MARRSHGTGRFETSELGTLGAGTVIEDGVLVFQPAHVHIGADVYVGHRTMLRGDTRGELRIGDRTWVGQECYMQSAGGIEIGADVGVGPRVSIITATHEETPPGTPIVHAPLEFAAVAVGDGCDIGLGAILLPGTHLGEGVQVGAGAVLRGSFPAGSVVAGVPGRVIRRRGESERPHG